MPARDFVFAGYAFDSAQSRLSLRYRYEEGPSFEERIFFDFAGRALSPVEGEALERAFRLILLLSGVSYLKAFVPEKLVCEAFPIDASTAAFVEKFYRKGLAEFAFKNGISLADRLSFERESGAPPAALALALPRRTLIPVGGGKDSIVVLECLKKGGEPLCLFALGDAEPIAETIALSGLPAIRARRRLDPALFALKENGAMDGHVPITGILSAIALAAAILEGADTIAMANEHSASAGNLTIDGVEINHQFSKSFEFETDFANYIENTLARGLRYFSLLRPLSEIAIAARFSRFPQYFSKFRSCNAAFRQDPKARLQMWCGNCPKCRFVFLALAPFVAKRELIAIFGRNLLGEPEQLEGFRALCGLGLFKPFECVGETFESAAVIAHLARQKDWQSEPVVRELAAALPRANATDFAGLFCNRHPHRVPQAYLEMLDACR
jgi:UDP-N-acetyl-alpha-D-muramoyl-L-alanyl-L-glutamate epimerase